MSVPDFQSFFKPILDIASDEKEHSLSEAREQVSSIFNLNDEDLSELLPSRNQTKYDNRVSWAISYLVQAKILRRPRRGFFQITDRGIELHSKSYKRIDVKILNKYPEFVEFHQATRKNKPDVTDIDLKISQTPEELLQEAYHNIRNDLANEILNKIKENSPKFFERLVIDLMVTMGYGGSRIDAGKSIGQSGDEGIDGIIKEDRLGLDVIYLQAKRWEGTVGRPEIQKFVGALHGKRAKKGVFITTGKFSSDAEQYVEVIDPKVIVIDGFTLANFMIDYNLGTTITANYEIKRIDSDYFEEQ